MLSLSEMGRLGKHFYQEKQKKQGAMNLKLNGSVTEARFKLKAEKEP